MTDTSVDEIASGIYRLSTYTEAIPGGFTFNQFLIDAEEPLLFHSGLRQLFPSVSAALATVIPIDRLRWLSFGHWEADESGAVNRWLQAAPAASAAIGSLGAAVSATDQLDRTPRSLASDEILELGGKRVRWLDTPHVPHGWDAGVLFEETTSTLFCGDLFTHAGPVASLTDGDIVGPAVATEDLFGFTCLTPSTAPTICRLADLEPRTLALMHGASFAGDGSEALRALADNYQRRLHEQMARPSE
ncbi:MAG: MBL fold metallo-hydrolase [Acidimicrobiales bacterium]